MTHDEIKAAWNAQADEHNQWDSLGEDEKIEWAASIAAAKERAARIRAQEEVVALKERIARAGVEHRRAVREAVLAERDARTPGSVPSAAPVVSDAQIKAVFLANGFTIKEGLTDLKPYVYQAARALLATGGQAQAVERGEVLVTVSGFTGSGKSAIAGEIEIMCRALGLQVEWSNGVTEKNMTHADWTTALELYNPRVRIIERNVPRNSASGADQ